MSRGLRGGVGGRGIGSQAGAGEGHSRSSPGLAGCGWGGDQGASTAGGRCAVLLWPGNALQGRLPADKTTMLTHVNGADGHAFRAGATDLGGVHEQV